MENHKKKFTDLELSFFCNQLAMILSSGISITEGMTMMLEEAETSEEREILSDITESYESLGSFEAALAQTGLFPAYFLQMVKIGEETGRSDDVFAALTLHYQREDAIRTSIRHALIYPLIMVGMMLTVITVLLVKVLPIFNQVYIQLGTEMTGFAGTLVALGTTLSQYTFLSFLILALFLTAAFFLFKRKLSQIPFTKKLFEKVAACRFASGMALTLSSGINPDHAMELVCALNDDQCFEKKLNHCQTLTCEGMDLAKALFQSGIFTGLPARMVSIGSKSGTMEQVMEQISALYQEEIDTKINQMLSIIEPALVITLSLIVGGILLSVMFPLLGILSSL